MQLCCINSYFTCLLTCELHYFPVLVLTSNLELATESCVRLIVMTHWPVFQHRLPVPVDQYQQPALENWPVCHHCYCHHLLKTEVFRTVRFSWHVLDSFEHKRAYRTELNWTGVWCQWMTVMLTRPEHSRPVRTYKATVPRSRPLHNSAAEDKRCSNEILFFEWTYLHNFICASDRTGAHCK